MNPRKTFNSSIIRIIRMISGSMSHGIKKDHCISDIFGINPQFPNIYGSITYLSETVLKFWELENQGPWTFQENCTLLFDGYRDININTKWAQSWKRIVHSQYGHLIQNGDRLQFSSVLQAVCSIPTSNGGHESTVHIFGKSIVGTRTFFVSLAFLEVNIKNGNIVQKNIYALTLPLFCRNSLPDWNIRDDWHYDILADPSYRISGRKNFFLVEMDSFCRQSLSIHACWKERAFHSLEHEETPKEVIHCKNIHGGGWMLFQGRKEWFSPSRA